MSLSNASITRSRASTRATRPAPEQRISLLDNAVAEDDTDGDGDPLSPSELDGEGLGALSRPSTSTRLGRERLREELARRKYRKYQKSRYEEETAAAAAAAAAARPTASRTATAASAELARLDTTDATLTAQSTLASPTTPFTPSPATPLTPAKDSLLRRGQQKVKALRRRRHHGSLDGETAIDVLWENQRGVFFFGRPYYSAASLLNFDPTAWTNIYGQPSAVDVHNAQLPDPHWEWEWKSWYVDMSLDVDEKGWQYSFMFQKDFSWHATHPFLFSFVRRRRWIRKRVRKHHYVPGNRINAGEGLKQAHRLNPDYFTIHPTRSRDAESLDTSMLSPAARARPPPIDEDDDITDVGALLKRLRRANVDRERLQIVLRFVDDGGQQLHYLAGEMAHVMGFFMYQYSRRALYAGMLARLEQLERLEAGGGKPDDDADTEGDKPADTADTDTDMPINDPPSQDHLDNLRCAVEAADAQIRTLEYWSDIRGLVGSGQSLSAADTSRGWDPSWAGVDRSGPAQEKALPHEA